VRILAFDTATRATAVALADGREAVELCDEPLPGVRPGHATCLMPLINQTMSTAAVGWERIDRIAVGLGPGTFTGLRIGVATAKALARATGIPVVGVSTLQSLALSVTLVATPIRSDVVVPVIDARRGEVYGAAWEPSRVGESPLLAPRALAPDALVAAVRGLGSSPVAVGDGAIAFREILESGGIAVPGDDDAVHRVRAISHCRLAPRLPVSDPDTLAPDYQRLPDAKPRSSNEHAQRHEH